MDLFFIKNVSPSRRLFQAQILKISLNAIIGTFSLKLFYLMHLNFSNIYLFIIQCINILFKHNH